MNLSKKEADLVISATVKSLARTVNQIIDRQKKECSGRCTKEATLNAFRQLKVDTGKGNIIQSTLKQKLMRFGVNSLSREDLSYLLDRVERELVQIFRYDIEAEEESSMKEQEQEKSFQRIRQMIDPSVLEYNMPGTSAPENVVRTRPRGIAIEGYSGQPGFKDLPSGEVEIQLNLENADDVLNITTGCNKGFKGITRKTDEGQIRIACERPRGDF